MANKSVVLYQSIKVKNKWKYRRAEGMLRDLSVGSYYMSYYAGSKKRMEPVGRIAKEALDLVKKKQLELLYVANGGTIAHPMLIAPISQPAPEPTQSASKPAQERKSIAAAMEDYLDDCRDRKGKSGYGMAPRTIETYSDCLPYLIAFRFDAYLDEVDIDFIRQFRRFLRKHPKDLSDRTAYNIMQSVSTFLNWHGNGVAKKILAEMSYDEKPVNPYTEEQVRAFFAACDEWEEMLFKFFLHTMGRDMEVANTIVSDLIFSKSVVHFSPKPERGFRLKGKRSGQAKKGRKIPVVMTYMARLMEFCKDKKHGELLFPNGVGGVQKHFLRMCKNIAKRAGLPDWNEFDLHRWRKTGATLHHEHGVSVRKIQAWLGHESLEVTLAYLGVEDAADEISQEQVNNGALAEFV